MGISLSDLFTTSGEPKEIQSHDKSIMEKVNMIESLAEEEKATIYKMLDAFLGKKKLKDALASVLKDVEWKKPLSLQRLLCCKSTHYKCVLVWGIEKRRYNLRLALRFISTYYA